MILLRASASQTTSRLKSVCSVYSFFRNAKGPALAGPFVYCCASLSFLFAEVEASTNRVNIDVVAKVTGNTC